MNDGSFHSPPTNTDASFTTTVIPPPASGAQGWPHDVGSVTERRCTRQQATSSLFNPPSPRITSVMLFSWVRSAVYVAVASSAAVNAISLDVTDPASIKSAASSVAYKLMTYYSGNQTGNEANLGLLPKPYYWWEAGAMWGGMVDYWHYTGDPTYNDVVAQAILSQASHTKDFMMMEQIKDLGNDDQVFWGLTAMSAAEKQFPNPSNSSTPWIALAEGVFNDLASRWNTTQCGGGLKWQWVTTNAGYDYKSSITNGGFFQLAARLARYTGNSTYSDWAQKEWDWMTAIGLIDLGFHVYDGANDLINCSQIDNSQWSYNMGAFIYGAAVMANISGPNNPWTTITKGFLTTANSTFFSPFANSTDVMWEYQCEKLDKCNNDQFSFKAYLGRWMVASTQMVPAIYNDVISLIAPSARSAAAACSGDAQSACGTKWYTGGYDGVTGVGQQLSALENIQGLLVGSASAPIIAKGS